VRLRSLRSATGTSATRRLAIGLRHVKQISNGQAAAVAAAATQQAKRAGLLSAPKCSGSVRWFASLFELASIAHEHCAPSCLCADL
jgi:hypothetical protein